MKRTCVVTRGCDVSRIMSTGPEKPENNAVLTHLFLAETPQSKGCAYTIRFLYIIFIYTPRLLPHSSSGPVIEIRLCIFDVASYYCTVIIIIIIRITRSHRGLCTSFIKIKTASDYSVVVVVVCLARCDIESSSVYDARTRCNNTCSTTPLRPRYTAEIVRSFS